MEMPREGDEWTVGARGLGARLPRRAAEAPRERRRSGPERSGAGADLSEKGGNEVPPPGGADLAVDGPAEAGEKSSVWALARMSSTICPTLAFVNFSKSAIA